MIQKDLNKLIRGTKVKKSFYKQGRKFWKDYTVIDVIYPPCEGKQFLIKVEGEGIDYINYLNYPAFKMADEEPSN